MEFNQLEIFLAIERLKSFSKAAEELHLTQPTVSNNINNLEKSLGVKLINRSGRRISLTSAGIILSQYAKEILNLRDRAFCEIDEHTTKVDGILRIMSSSVPKQYILPYIIKDFKKVYPKVHFEVSDSNSKIIVDEILSGKLSYGIVGVETRFRAIEKIAIHEDDLVLVTPANIKFGPSFSRKIDPEEILDMSFIFRKEESGTRVFIEKSLESLDISSRELKISSIVDSNEMIKKMVELGQGVAFLPRISIENEVRLDLIRAFDVEGIDSKRKFYFIYSKHRTLPPNVEAFKNFLKDWPGVK